MGGVTWRIIPAVVPQAEGVHRAHDDEGAICVAVCVISIHWERIFYEGFLLKYYLWQKERRSYFVKGNNNWMEENPHWKVCGAWTATTREQVLIVQEMKQEWRKICILKMKGKTSVFSSSFSMFLLFSLLHLRARLFSLLFPVLSHVRRVLVRGQLESRLSFSAISLQHSSW